MADDRALKQHLIKKESLVEIEEHGVSCGQDHTGAFEYVIAIRMPKHAAKKKKEQEKFAHYLNTHYAGKTARDFLLDHLTEDAIATKNVKLDFDGDEMSLEGTLNCIIGLIFSLFDSLAESFNAEIDILKFSSIEKNKLFICTRMSAKLAETLADMAEYPVQLSPEGIEKLGIKLTKHLDTLVPAFVKFDAKQKEEGLLRVFDHHSKEVHVLRHMDRVRLMYDKITDYIRLNELMAVFQPMSITLKMFVCHDAAEVTWLLKHWANWRRFFSLNFPIEEVKDYVGEGQAFYFLFTNTVERALAVLLIPAAVVFWAEKTQDPETVVMFQMAFYVVIVIWISCFVKYWKRRETYYANVWGTDFTHVNTTVKEVINPEFEGRPVPSQTDENISERRVETTQRRKALTISVIVTLLLMVVVVIVVVGLQVAAAGGWLPDIVEAHFGILLSVVIKAFATLYTTVATWLTTQEQHPFMKQRAQSYGVKSFFFGTFNTFFGFLWIAYAKSCKDDEGCQTSLESTLIMAFPTLLVLIGVDTLMPFLQIKYKYLKQAGDLKRDLGDEPVYQISLFEQQTKMLEYGDDEQTRDFLQIFSPLCFVTLFSVVAPFEITALALFAVALQFRADSYRVLVLYQRVFPARVADIGVWNAVLKFVNVMSIINVSLLFAKNYCVYIYPNIAQVKEIYEQLKTKKSQDHYLNLVTIAVFCFVYFTAQTFMIIFDMLVSDTDEGTQLEKKRQIRQRARLFDFEQGEFHEHIKLTGTTKWTAKKPLGSFHDAAKLEPGEKLYVKPILF